MIGIEQYQKIQEYKELGLARTKNAKKALMISILN